MVGDFQLRQRISAANRWQWFFGVHLFILGLYLFTNRIQLYEPMVIDKTWVDHHTPFLPLSVWIYLSYYLSFVSVFLWEKDTLYLNKFAYAFLMLNLVCNAIFFLFPTAYDRSTIVFPTSMDGLTIWAFKALHLVDAPANCLPSLHVANIFLASFAWLGRFPRRSLIYLVWACLVSLSTLTTKQHYLVDTILGFLFAYLAYRCFFLKLNYEQAPS